MKNKTYKQYLAERKNTMPHYHNRAIDAWRHIVFKRKFDAWLKEIDAPHGFYTDSDNVAHEFTDDKGYRYVFKIEPDYYVSYMYDDMKSQGYDYDVREGGYSKPGFAEHGNVTRHSGEGFRMWLDLSNDRHYIPAVFDVPESYTRQFYDNKNYSKHEAYTNMVASARMAIEQGVNTYCKTDYCDVSVTVYAPDGEEIETDGLGGCDLDSSTSGRVFYEHDMLDTLREAAAKHYAETQPQAIQQNYACGAYI